MRLLQLIEGTSDYIDRAKDARRNISLDSVVQKALDMAQTGQFTEERTRAINFAAEVIRSGKPAAVVGREWGYKPHKSFNHKHIGLRLLMRAYTVLGGTRSGVDFQSLIEAPIGDFGTIGDFSDPNASIPNAADRRAVTAEPMIRRIKLAWEKTPFLFNLFFANVPGAQKWVEQGYVSAGTVRSEFPDMASRIMAGKADKAITVVFTNNLGDAGISFTPWIMAHRISHAMVVPNNTNDPRQGVQNRAFYTGSEKLYTFTNSLIYQMFSRSTVRVGSDTHEQIYRHIYEYIGTMKSARSKLLARPNEFYHELFAQYLLNGDITFNAFTPEFLLNFAEDSGTGEQPHIEHLDTMLGEMNETLAGLKQELLNSFTAGLSHAQGKVIFM